MLAGSLEAFLVASKNGWLTVKSVPAMLHDSDAKDVYFPIF